MIGKKQHKQKRKVSHLLEVVGAVIFFFLCRLLGLDLSSRFGGFLGERIGPLFRRNKVARQNIKRALIELNDEEVEEVLRMMWRNAGRAFGEYPHLSKFCKQKYLARMELVISPQLKETLEEMKGKCFFFSAHLTNWELMPIIPIRLSGSRGVEIYQRLANPYINRWVKSIRQKITLAHQVERNSGVRDIVRYIKKGYSFTVLTDQKMLSGEWNWFFHQPAQTSEFAANVALKYDYMLIPVHIKRIDEKGKTKFQMIIEDPLEVRRSGDREADIQRMTQQINYCLEVLIREQPENWLWLHNRWPADAEQTRRERTLLERLPNLS